MLPEMTPAVSRAVEASSCFASSFVEPIHLLYALLDEEHGRAMTLAQQAGLDFERYQQARQAPGPVHPVPLSARVESLLYRARELTFVVSGGGVITSEALLLALLREEAQVMSALADCGLSLDRLETLLVPSLPTIVPVEEPLHLADLTEQGDVARILDAGFNRAREGLRVIEDYGRFVLEDAFLTGQLKELRHELTAVFAEHGPQHLVVSRDTIGDVGTTISLGSERERASLGEVVEANCKRLQEALRSLEEFAKISVPILAERIEQLRYRAYTLERALLLGEKARTLLRDARLYVLLSSATCSAALDWTIAEAAQGGATIIQLREKSITDRELLRRARAVRRWTRQAGVLFIVNDRPDIARLVEAEGVHLGQDDMPVKEARRIMGPESLVGVSTHSIEQVRQAILDGASYIGIGPVFPSETKAFAVFPGLELVHQACAETSIPTFAIGGIHAGNIARVVASGARRVAVSGAIAQADEPRRSAAELVAELRSCDEGSV
jgi:thiamine-phosphate pyrophosphorylase